jgi:hypothetical protein
VELVEQGEQRPQEMELWGEMAETVHLGHILYLLVVLVGLKEVLLVQKVEQVVHL